MGLPEGPPTAWLLALMLVRRAAAPWAARASWRPGNWAARAFDWANRRGAWKEYKRYVVEDYVDAGRWRALLRAAWRGWRKYGFVARVTRSLFR